VVQGKDLGLKKEFFFFIISSFRVRAKSNKKEKWADVGGVEYRLTALDKYPTGYECRIKKWLCSKTS